MFQQRPTHRTSHNVATADKTKQRTLNGKRRIQRSILRASNIQTLRKIHHSRFETHDIAISESPIVPEAVFR
jgi:hypothetical protein